MFPRARYQWIVRWFRQICLNALILAIDASAAFEGAARKFSRYLEERKALLGRKAEHDGR